MTNQKLKRDKVKMIFGIVLVSIGVLSRTLWHIGDNIEMVTTATLLAGSFLGLGWALIVPAVIMIITDLILGNTNIFLFTWSAYLVIGYLGYLCHLGSFKGAKKIFLSGVMGVVASFWFYLWTNFGVWLLDSWGMYPKTLQGLIDSFVMGLPFLKNNLAGNIILVPLFFLIVEPIIQYLNKNSLSTQSNHKMKFV